MKKYRKLVSKDDVEAISNDEEVQEIVEISHKPDSASLLLD